MKAMKLSSVAMCITEHTSAGWKLRELYVGMLSCFYEILMLEKRNFFFLNRNLLLSHWKYSRISLAQLFFWKNCLRTKLCDFHWEVEKFCIRSAVCFLISLESNAIIELSGLCSVRWRQLHANIPSRSFRYQKPTSYDDDELDNSYFRRKPTSFLSSNDAKRYTWMVPDEESVRLEGPRPLHNGGPYIVGSYPPKSSFLSQSSEQITGWVGRKCLFMSLGDVHGSLDGSWRGRKLENWAVNVLNVRPVFSWRTRMNSRSTVMSRILLSFRIFTSN